MEQLKVTSKKYNDKDILEVEGLKEAVENVLSGQLGNIDLSKVPQIEEDFNTLPEETFNEVKGKVWFSVTEGNLVYPLNSVGFFEIDGTVIKIVFYFGSGDSFDCDSEQIDLENIIQVQANPTLAGTESPLTGLRVGDDKYKVNSGTQLYRHTVLYKYESEPDEWTTLATIVYVSRKPTRNSSSTDISLIQQEIYNYDGYFVSVDGEDMNGSATDGTQSVVCVTGDPDMYGIQLCICDSGASNVVLRGLCFDSDPARLLIEPNDPVAI